jgi:HlyD family type I secretion membrane fusion protein
MSSRSLGQTLERESWWRSVAVDNPRREMLIGGVLVASFFGVFLGWAALAPLDAAASAPGVVAVSGARQTVQHPEGGVVSQILVREGQAVAAKQPLVILASQELVANERSLVAQVIARKVEIARLEAEQTGQALSAPPEFARWAPDDQALAEHALLMADGQLRAQRSANTLRRGVLRQRIAQTRQQIAGAGLQIESNAVQQRLNEDELRGTRALAAQGYAPMTRVRALERSAAELVGDAGARQAEIGSLKANIGEVALEISRGDSERLQQVEDQLRLARMDLQGVEPRWIAVRQQVERATLRAPVAGEVVGLAVNTVGGVVGAGQAVLAIVPKAAPLVVEARFSPQSIDGVEQGKPAEVRFSGFQDRKIPIIHGQLTRVSADTLTDDRTGQSYYTAEVTVPPAELAKVGRLAHVLKAGQPAQVLVPLRKRTLLDYILEPLTGMSWASLREH